MQGRNCVELGGVWIDEGYDAKTKSVTVKAQSDAYFKILDKHPEIRDVFRLGNHLVWISPSGTALIVDANSGKEELDDEGDRGAVREEVSDGAPALIRGPPQALLAEGFLRLYHRCGWVVGPFVGAIER